MPRFVRRSTARLPLMTLALRHCAGSDRRFRVRGSGHEGGEMGRHAAIGPGGRPHCSPPARVFPRVASRWSPTHAGYAPAAAPRG